MSAEASIGLGQFANAMRRGVRMAYIVENNGVYGLTKGQFSATADQEAEKAKGEDNPEVQQVIQQAEQVIAQKDELMQGAVQKIEELMQQVQQMQDEREIKAGELKLKSREIGVKEYDAETKRAQVLAPAFGPEQIQALVMQTLQDIFNQPVQQMPEPVPMAPLMEMMPEPMPEQLPPELSM